MSGRRSLAPPARALHPLAWWAWAAGLGVCAIKTTNPLLLCLIAAVVVFVVAARRTDAPWARSFGFFVKMGLAVIAIRVGIEVLFGERGLPGHVLFHLPRLPLPGWAAGVSIGGAVTVNAIAGAFIVGLQLAVILLCVGAANTLASPYRLLRSLPAVLYEAGVAVTVALAFAPELVATIANVREARRLRGRPNRGAAGLRGMAVPVLEGALDRSLQLASSMDARGYGRRGSGSSTQRRACNALLGAGLVAVAVGVFGVLDAAVVDEMGLPVLAAGMAMCAASLALGARRSVRTRYRPDPWRFAEWATLCSGIAAVAGITIAEALGAGGVQYATVPLAAPGLPALAVTGVACGLLPALVAPGPPTPLRDGVLPSASPITAAAQAGAKEATR